MTRITIIGLGLIGGSMAKDLRSQLNVHVTGVDNDTTNAEKARSLNLVDEIATMEDGIASADIIIIAIPVNRIQELLPALLDKISPTATVIDVGSTKEEICKCIESHPKRGRFVAAHPLSGTEFSGPEAAVRGLFMDKKNIICDKELSEKDAVEQALQLFQSIGLDSYFMSSSDHDKHLAYVSHLSHISSFTLSLTVLDIEKDESQIFNLASTGFQSTSRLAKSNPNTWSPIFEKNNIHLVEALDRYANYLQKFKKAIQEKDSTSLHNLMTQANDIKRVLIKK